MSRRTLALLAAGAGVVIAATPLLRHTVAEGARWIGEYAADGVDLVAHKKRVFLLRRRAKMQMNSLHSLLRGHPDEDRLFERFIKEAELPWDVKFFMREQRAAELAAAERRAAANTGNDPHRPPTAEIAALIDDHQLSSNEASDMRGKWSQAG